MPTRIACDDEVRRDHSVQAGGVSDLFGLEAGPDLSVLSDRPRFSAFAHKEATQILRDGSLFSSSWFSWLLDDFIGPSIISMDEPHHRRLRLLVQPAFSKARMDWWRSLIEPSVERALDRVEAQGSCDLSRDVGEPVPMEVILEALGLPADQRERFFEWAVAMISPAETPERRRSAAERVAEQVLPAIAGRRRSPGNDLLSVLVEASIAEDDADGVIDHRPLSDEEITSFVRLLIIVVQIPRLVPSAPPCITSSVTLSS